MLSKGDRSATVLLQAARGEYFPFFPLLLLFHALTIVTSSPFLQLSSEPSSPSARRPTSEHTHALPTSSSRPNVLLIPLSSVRATYIDSVLSHLSSPSAGSSEVELSPGSTKACSSSAISLRLKKPGTRFASLSSSPRNPFPIYLSFLPTKITTS